MRIPKMSESSKALPIKVDSQWLVTNTKDINTHIKFFASNKQRIHNISLHNIRFSLRAFWFPSELILPLGNLLQFIKQKDDYNVKKNN